MDKVILNANVFKRGKFYADHGVVIKNDKIIAVAPSKELKTLKQVSIIDVQGDYLVPGFIDLHTHGLGTFRMDNGKDSIEQISSYLPQFGTTGFLPTIVPHLPSEEERFFQEIVESRSIGANILGFFLEGPFISKTGAINPKTLVNQTRSRARAMRELLKPYRVVFAISPEFPGIDEIMQEMEKPIFITHTQANVKESLAAIAN
ncbi:MAG: hypothetical protein PHU24_11020, partial [Sphaerochaetaceae bacterium]|nr:hypothetical protein [Sphaerochaetaceae bacterium]